MTTTTNPAIIDLDAATKYIDMLLTGEWGVGLEDRQPADDDDFGLSLFRRDDNIMSRSQDGLDCECGVDNRDWLTYLLVGKRREHVSLYLL